jgi:alkylhydroperoxidase family enzyme
MAHSQFGREAGLSEDDMGKLIHLEAGDFDRKKWVALAWARDWALFRGDMPDEDLVSEFESLYTEQERRDILATVTVMDFANRFMNTTSGDVLELEEEYPDQFEKKDEAGDKKEAE